MTAQTLVNNEGLSWGAVAVFAAIVLISVAAIEWAKHRTAKIAAAWEHDIPGLMDTPRNRVCMQYGHARSDPDAPVTKCSRCHRDRRIS